MARMKIVRIRSCVQCGIVLGHKCISCVNHPERIPRTIEIYDWPIPLKVAECGCCGQFKCANRECRALPFWRFMQRNAGKNLAKKLFCGQTCSAANAGRSRDTRQEVACAYCKKTVVRKAYALKTFKHAFCKPECFFLYRALKRDEEKKIRDQDSLLQCVGACGGLITEHSKGPRNISFCKVCGVSRNDSVVVGSNSKSMRVSTLR